MATVGQANTLRWARTDATAANVAQRRRHPQARVARPINSCGGGSASQSSKGVGPHAATSSGR